MLTAHPYVQTVVLGTQGGTARTGRRGRRKKGRRHARSASHKYTSLGAHISQSKKTLPTSIKEKETRWHGEQWVTSPAD
eukprot:1157866-Pelagomonas_calceolata.AAC.1